MSERLSDAVVAAYADLFTESKTVYTDAQSLARELQERRRESVNGELLAAAKAVVAHLTPGGYLPSCGKPKTDDLLAAIARASSAEPEAGERMCSVCAKAPRCKEDGSCPCPCHPPKPDSCAGFYHVPRCAHFRSGESINRTICKPEAGDAWDALSDVERGNALEMINRISGPRVYAAALSRLAARRRT